MDKETEARLKKKIMANEELTEEEKKFFKNYDEWKVEHDRARKATIEGLRWNAWPALFICAFFLFSTTFQNIRYLQAVNWQAEPSVYAITIISCLLGTVGAVGAFWMKHKASKIFEQANQVTSITLAEEPEENTED